jgi:hypothetical protein
MGEIRIEEGTVTVSAPTLPVNRPPQGSLTFFFVRFFNPTSLRGLWGSCGDLRDKGDLFFSDNIP